MSLTKLNWWERGYAAFESGKRIAAWGHTKSWQRKEYRTGYMLAEGYSLICAETPNEYQEAKLKEMIKAS